MNHYDPCKYMLEKSPYQHSTQKLEEIALKRNYLILASEI